MCNQKIVVITNGNYFASLILADIFRQRASDISGVLIVTGDYKGRTGLHALWEVGKTTVLPYLGYKLIIILAFSIAQRFHRQAHFSVEKLATSYTVPVRSVVVVNSDEALAWVAEQKPDLLVSVSCPQMIKRRMLSLARLGGINIHSSLLPAYAGLAPYYWALSNGERRTGTTVHYMTSEFDKGNILVQRTADIEQGESAFHLFRRLAQLGAVGLADAIEYALCGNPGTSQDLSAHTYYSHPDFRSYIALRRQRHVILRIAELLSAIRSEARTGFTTHSS
jgi:folate-dependent phosphoribosylglycinamide formyltransferase PurN